MPMLYREGKKAFCCLQLEIIRETSNHSIFAWCMWMPQTGSVLAEDPSDFRDCCYIQKVKPNEFINKLVKYIKENKLGRRNRWACQCKLVALCDTAHSQQFHTFTVSNAGIQVFLPVIPLPYSLSHFRAILACTGFGGLATIDLVSSGSSFDRIPDINDSTFTTYPEFKTLHLTHHQDVNEKRHEFTLDDKHALYHEFICCGTYPHEFWGNVVTLSSLTDDLIVIVYVNNDARSCFTVGLGYYCGQGWVHVICDGYSPPQEADWINFGRRAYHWMWNAHAKHAQSMPKHKHEDPNDHFTKHIHLPQSIWAARVVWGRWEMVDFKVMVDIEQCPGCCDGPCRWMTTENDCGTLCMPGLMKMVQGPYLLRLDGWKVCFEKCSGQWVALGDYGDYSDGILIQTDSIFEDMLALSMDPKDSTYSSVVSCISDGGW
ncbi:hypothetical protein EDC04DRAFT_3002319 [Pisolithus marmoratus]|nr:hypothetical protein EDC04DRAFT_3002319 [Pisolithus marmoratus]